MNDELQARGSAAAAAVAERLGSPSKRNWATGRETREGVQKWFISFFRKKKDSNGDTAETTQPNQTFKVWKQQGWVSDASDHLVLVFGGDQMDDRIFQSASHQLGHAKTQGSIAIHYLASGSRLSTHFELMIQRAVISG